MENEFKIFESEEFGKLRTAVINGVSWFSGKDAAISLEYKDTDQAIRVNVEDSDKIILNQKDIEKMASESNPVQNTGFKIESPRGLIFINISGLFSLILSSKMPKAKKYRHWVTSKILPSIYFKGYYIAPNAKKKAAAEKIIVEKPVIVEKQVVVEKPVVVPNQPLPKYHEFVKEIFKSARIIHQDSGLDYNLCVLTVAEMMEEKYGIDLTHIKNLFPVEDPEIEYYTPTQIGKLIGQKNGTIKYSAKKVNKLLIKYGLQEKDIKGNYSLTEQGKNYGVAIPYFNNGRTGLQVKWSDKVLELF